MRPAFIFLLIIIALCLACQSGGSRLSPHQERIAGLYANLITIQEDIPANSPAYADTVRALLKLSGLTEQEFRDTITALNEEPERWEAFYKEVLNRLNVDETHPRSPQN